MRNSILVSFLACILVAGCSGGGSTKTPPLTPAAAAPTFSPAAGTFTSVQTIALSDSTAGAAIHYTTDGTTPTASSTLYSSPIKISTTTTIEAIAAASGYNNSVAATATFTINLPAAAMPTFSPAPGTFTSTQTVTLADSTTGASIYYTTDGSNHDQLIRSIRKSHQRDWDHHDQRHRRRVGIQPERRRYRCVHYRIGPARPGSFSRPEHARSNSPVTAPAIAGSLSATAGPESDNIVACGRESAVPDHRGIRRCIYRIPRPIC